MRIIAALLFLATAQGGLVPQVLSVSSEEPRAGGQWVQADPQGRAVLLDGVTLEARSFHKGTFLDPQRLQQAAVFGGVVRRAELSRDGAAWLFHSPPDLRYFKEGEEKRLPQPDYPIRAIGFHDGQPVVSVVPYLRGRVRPPGFEPPEVAPLVLARSGDEWVTLLERRNLAEGDTTQARLDSALVFTTDAKRNLWAAHQYRYRIYQVSPAGKLRFTLEADDGRPVSDEATEEERAVATEALRKEALASGMSMDGVTVTAITQKPIIDGIAAGRDGNIYLFVYSEGSPALDRYNPYSNTLERLPLRLDYRGSVSMAAAREGLMMAGYSASSGIWMLSWERLEAARWKPVEGATGDGLPLSPSPN